MPMTDNGSLTSIRYRTRVLIFDLTSLEFLPGKSREIIEKLSESVEQIRVRVRNKIKRWAYVDRKS